LVGQKKAVVIAVRNVSGRHPLVEAARLAAPLLGDKFSLRCEMEFISG
jgi:hypothetical protein